MISGGIDEEDGHFAIVSSYFSTSTKDSEAMTNVADIPDEVSKRLDN